MCHYQEICETVQLEKPKMGEYRKNPLYKISTFHLQIQKPVDSLQDSSNNQTKHPQKSSNILSTNLKSQKSKQILIRNLEPVPVDPVCPDPRKEPCKGERNEDRYICTCCFFNWRYSKVPIQSPLAIVSLTNVGRSSATGEQSNMAASNRVPDQCRPVECYRRAVKHRR